MVETILRSISANIGRLGSENSQFRQVAAQQNTSISKFIKDISRMFSSQGKQQTEISSSLNDLQQVTAGTGQKVDQTNSLLQESISIQTQMLTELKNVSSALLRFIQPAGEEGGTQGSFASTFLNMAGGAAIGAGIAGATNTMLDNLDSFNGSFGGGNKDTGGGEKLSVSDMVKLAKDAGFSEEQAVIMGAIGAAESSGNPNAHNPNVFTGDDSYGLWQINMLGKMGPSRRQQFGISSNQELWTPEINAKAAKEIFDQQGFGAWSVYKNGAYKQFLGTARESIGNGKQTTPEGDGDFIKQSSPINLQKYSLKDPSHVQGLDKSFQTSLGKFLNAAEEAGHSIKIYSGYRSPERQQELFKNAVAKYGSPEAARKWVAPPGRSRHNSGVAADLDYQTSGAKQWAHQNASKYGLNFRMGHEPWHIEPANAGSMVSDSGGESMGTGIGSVGGGALGLTGGNVLGDTPADFSSMFAGTPLASLSGIMSGISSATSAMMGGLPLFNSLFGGGMGQTSSLETSPVASLDKPEPMATIPYSPVNVAAKPIEAEKEMASMVPVESPKLDSDFIQTSALSNEAMMYNRQPSIAPIQTNPNESYQQNQDLQRGGMPSTTSYSSTTPWYLQLAGRVSNDETMKFKGGVFA